MLHSKLGRQWKVIAFHMFCVDRRICTFFILRMHGNQNDKHVIHVATARLLFFFEMQIKTNFFEICGYIQMVHFDMILKEE
jgi:hypothetical protein